MRLSRFERKILAAMALVAFMPLVGALVLGSAVVSDAYRAGVNERIHEQLEGSVALHRRYLTLLREDAERTTDSVAFHARMAQALAARDQDALSRELDAALERYPHVATLRVLEDDGVLVERARPERLGPQAHRPPLVLTRRLDDGHTVEVVAAAPQAIFDELQVAGEETAFYERLLEQSAFVSDTYLWVYIAFLALVAGAALTLGVVLSRRVTGRVTDLAHATRRVGAGDLDVMVPSGGDDEVRELTAAFNAMVRDLRESRTRIEYLQRIGAWQQFARRLAHEIKNPLTPILLAAQEMVRSYDGEDTKYLAKLEDACAIIEEEVATLRRLVGEFSAFAKLPEAHLSRSDLRDFLGDVERTLPAICDDVFHDDDERPEVVLDVEDAPMPVEIDAMMLKRCVDNLVRNALQALRGRESGRVRVRAERFEGEVLLRIEDDGPGVPDEECERVFDPYFTTKRDGTGLGLAIVKKVVLEHGGTIGYETSELGGACFAIRLPLADDESA